MARICEECGAEVVEGAVYCQKCGHRVDADSVAGVSATHADDREAEPATEPSMDDADQGEQFIAEKLRAAHADKTPDAQAEKQLWEGGYSGKALLGNWILATLLVIVISVAAFYFFATSTAVYIMLIAAVVLFGGVGLQLIFRKLNVHYVVTDQRLIHRLGVLKQVTDRIEMIDIDDVTFEQGPVQRLLGIGNIKVLSSDRTHPTLYLQGIADVDRIASLIDDTRRAERRRRGLHIEQI